MNLKILQKNNRAVKAALIGLVSLVGLAVYAQPALRIHGAATTKVIVDQHLTEITAATGLHIDFVGNGSDVGLLDLVTGQADVAAIAAPLEDVAKKINDRQTGAVDTSKLKDIPLGNGKFVLIVNTNNPVRRMSNQQAVGLLSGKIKNWKELGGADETVVVVVPPDGNGARVAFEKELLHTEKWSPDIRVVSSLPEIRSVVAQSPRSVGIMGVVSLSERVAPVTLDSEIQSAMSLVVVGEPSANVLKLADTIKPFVK